MKRRVFIDMDGVLCEYNEDASLEDMEKDGYFRWLSPRPAMLEAVKGLMESGEAEVFVLSAVLPQVEESARADKNAWLNEHLPALDSSHRIFPLCGTNKADAVNGIRCTDILFDDYSANLKLWQEAGGKAVKILNECNGKNGSFVSGPRLRITGRNQIVDMLRAM